MIRRLVSLASVIFLGTDCTSPTGPRPAVELRTNAVAYAAQLVEGTQGPSRYAFDVVVGTRNTGREPVTIARCRAEDPMPIFGIELDGGTDPFGAAYDGVWACPTAAPFVLPAGEARVDTLRIVGPNAFDGFTHKPYGALSGVMRVMYEIDGARVRSNRFDVSLRDE